MIYEGNRKIEKKYIKEKGIKSGGINEEPLLLLLVGNHIKIGNDVIKRIAALYNNCPKENNIRLYMLVIGYGLFFNDRSLYNVFINEIEPKKENFNKKLSDKWLSVKRFFERVTIDRTLELNCIFSI